MDLRVRAAPTEPPQVHKRALAQVRSQVLHDGVPIKDGVEALAVAKDVEAEFHDPPAPCVGGQGQTSHKATNAFEFPATTGAEYAWPSTV